MRSPADNPAGGDLKPGLLHPLTAIVVCFGAVFVLSQFFRASNAVIAKTLSAEFGLTPEALGLLTGMFFLSFGAAQIPVGMLFDRFGARRTAPVVLTAAIAGSILYGLADGEAMLMAGRLLLGIGCSVVLMGSLFLFGQWAPAASFSTWMGRMIAIGGAGGLLSTTPLAAVADALGWRVAFWGAAGLTAAGAVAIYAMARDRPPADKAAAQPQEDIRASLRGVRAALATPGFPTLILMGFASYPVVITVLGLWGGPSLADRHGLEPVEAGNALLVMAAALIVANLVLGPLERRLDVRKGLILALAAVVVVGLGRARRAAGPAHLGGDRPPRPRRRVRVLQHHSRRPRALSAAQPARRARHGADGDRLHGRAGGAAGAGRGHRRCLSRDERRCAGPSPIRRSSPSSQPWWRWPA